MVVSLQLALKPSAVHGQSMFRARSTTKPTRTDEQRCPKLRRGTGRDDLTHFLCWHAGQLHIAYGRSRETGPSLRISYQVYYCRWDKLRRHQAKLSVTRPRCKLRQVRKSSSMSALGALWLLDKYQRARFTFCVVTANGAGGLSPHPCVH